MKCFLISSYIFFFCITFTFSLYEDQVGKYDWRQQYIGQAHRLVIEPGGAGAPRRLFIGALRGVVAAVSLRNGHLAWRQLLEEGQLLDELIMCGKGVFSVSGGGRFLRSWNPALGHLEWEIAMSENSLPAVLTCQSAKSTLLSVVGTTIRAISSKEGAELWQKSLTISSVDHVWANERGTGWLIAGQFGENSKGIELVSLLSSGVVDKTSTVMADWLLPKREQCQLLEVGFLCLDAANGALQLLKPGANEFTKYTFVSDFGLKEDGRALKLTILRLAYHMVSVHMSNGEAHIFVVEEHGPKLRFTVPNVDQLSVAENEGQLYLIAAHLSDKTFDNLEVRLFNFNTDKSDILLRNKFALAKHHGSLVEIQGILFSKKDGALTYRLVVMTSDYAIQVIQAQGGTLWLREEALATVLATKMLDLPVSENQAKMEEEFGHHQSADVISMFLKRITTQASQLKSFLLTQLLRHRQRLSSSGVGDESAAVVSSASEKTSSSVDDLAMTGTVELTRDDFSLHKLIVVSTEVGKLFGLDSATGKSVWKLLLPDCSPISLDSGSGDYDAVNVLPIFLQRSTAHFPLPPQAAALARQRTSGRAFLFFFNPFTGVPSPAVEQPRAFDRPLQQAVLLHVTPAEAGHYLRPILLLDTALRVHVYPSDFPLHLAQQPIFLYTAQVNGAHLRGYRVVADPSGVPGRYLAQAAWTVRLAANNSGGSGTQRLVALAERRGAEQVHSIGRVLGDRSVLYKYLNPNLVAAAVEEVVSGTSTAQATNSISVFLVDTVSGKIVFGAHTKRASGPVQLVNSENWVVYSYWNVRARRDEVAVLELFDQSMAHLSEFSSLQSSNSSTGPLVMRQAYILPTPAQKLAVSLTEKGITSKSILVMLRTGGLLEMPKAFLDPRRPLEPTAEHAEEGVVPYMPELPMSTQSIVNYNQSLPRVRAIHTASAGLESTSLVFVYGLDLYFTRVMPSKMFDVLKEDFDYFLISLVTIGMVVGSIVTQRLAARKALYRAWN